MSKSTELDLLTGLNKHEVQDGRRMFTLVEHYCLCRVRVNLFIVFYIVFFILLFVYVCRTFLFCPLRCWFVFDL